MEEFKTNLFQQLSVFCEQHTDFKVLTTDQEHICKLNYNDVVLNKFQITFIDIDALKDGVMACFEEMEMKNVMYVPVSESREMSLFALQKRALDFLVKPVAQDELLRVVCRAKDDNMFKSIEGVRAFFEMYTQKSFKRVAIPTINGNVFIYLHEIMRCEADVNYTKVFLIDETCLFVSKTLKYFEDKLPETIFFRTHQSHIVNVNYILKFECVKSIITLDNGNEIEVSRRKKKALKDYFDLN